MLSKEEIENLKFEDLKKINETINLLTEQRKKIEEADEKEIVITDHAVVRYLERIEKRDVKSEIKKELERKSIPKLLSILGAGTFGVGKFKIVMEKNLVKTIL